MRVAVTATGPDLEADLDPRFGRCACFLIVETDDLSYEAVENPNISLGGGAGIQSAQLIAKRGVTQVLTGNCGPNAYQTLTSAGVGVIVGCSGSIRNLVERYKSGEITPAGGPNVESHAGMGGFGSTAPFPSPSRQGGGGRGTGRGMGRGGGMGRGMGRGRGMGDSVGVGTRSGFPDGPASGMEREAPARAREEELNELRQKAEAMNQQMQEILRRIQDL